MPGRLERVEIFATGRHRGSSEVVISEPDLEAMVESFQALGNQDGFKPVLKLGHSETQTFFGNNKGAPNLGFVETIWKEGEKILANFSNVPDAVVDMIRNGRYNSVSIEMFPRAEYGGKVFSNVLTAVALLGAELPAVKGLKSLAASLFDEMEGEKISLITCEEKDMPATYSKEQLDELVAAAVAKAKDEAVAEFEAKVTSLEEKVAKAEEAKKTAQSALREFEAASAKREAEILVDDAIKEGKILPAQKDAALAFATSVTGKVKFGDEEKSATEVFAEFIGALPKKVDFDEKGASESKKVVPASAAEEVDTRARALMSEKADMDYAAARREVLEANADLKQRYFEMEV